MAIKNAPKKPKASSKTDAMKAMNAEAAESPEVEEASSTPVPMSVAPRPFAGVLRNFTPRPIVREAPVGVARHTNRAEADEESDDEDTGLATPNSKKPLVAFDAQVWQWVGDTGAFVHIKTGESRQEDEFFKPGGRNEEDGEVTDWDAPQDSANDW